MKGVFCVTILLLLTLSINTYGQLPSAKLDTLCNALTLKRSNFFVRYQYLTYWQKDSISAKDLQSVISCFKNKLKGKLTDDDELAICLLEVKWLNMQGDLGKAILLADEYSQKCKKSGNIKNLCNSYYVLSDLYRNADLKEEAYNYSRLIFHTIKKISTKQEMIFHMGSYAWSAFQFGGQSNNLAYYDTAAYYQKLVLNDHANDTVFWSRVEEYKTYLMSIGRLNRNNEVIEVGHQAVQYVNNFKRQKGSRLDLDANDMNGYYYGYMAMAFLRLGNKDSTFFYLNKPEIFDIGKTAINCYSKADGQYIQYYHIREKLKAYLEFDQPKKALVLLDDAIFSKERVSDVNQFSQSLHSIAAPIYEKYGEHKKAATCYRISRNYNDSITKIENAARAESEKTNTLLKIKYQQEKALDEQNRLVTEAKYEKRNRNFIVGGAAIITIILLVFLVLMFNRFKFERRQKVKIEEKEKETQEQNKIISLQKSIVEEKQKEIFDSINYAEKIQRTLFANHEMVNQNIPDSFVMFKPKDVVSGDFYWATKRDGCFYLAVCDSTGHGVPGAFMSLLNISFLNEAIIAKGIKKPNEIFDFVRNKLITHISHEGRQDGMDGILLCIDEKDEITYASANNRPIIVRDDQCIEYPGDKMPVGMGQRDEPFKLFSFEIKKGDMLYLFTDGYADQFGGPLGKKFKYRKLNELLIEISTKSILEQKQALIAAFDIWKLNLEQVDDVCVLGIRL